MRKRAIFYWMFLLCLMALGVEASRGIAAVPVEQEAGESAWQPLGPDWATMFAISADPNDPMRLYARSRAGVHRSVDGGDSWALVEDAYTFGGDALCW